MSDLERLACHLEEIVKQCRESNSVSDVFVCSRLPSGRTFDFTIAPHVTDTDIGVEIRRQMIEQTE